MLYQRSNPLISIQIIQGSDRRNKRQKRDISRDLIDLEKNRVQIKSVISDIENTLRTFQQEYAKSEARIKAAAEINYSGPVEAILSARKSKELPGIYGTIAELGKLIRNIQLPLR